MSRVTIRPDRILVCDGKPFFPLQARHLPVGATWKDMAEAGFNCYRVLMCGGLNMRPQPLPEHSHGLKLCAYLYNRFDLRHSRSHRAELTALVKQLRGREDLLAYENCNEPAWRPDEPTRVYHRAEDLATGYRLVKQLDPHHPVHEGFGIGGTVEAVRAYTACSDIMSCNPYPVLPPRMRQHIGIRADGRALDSPDQTLSAVVDYTRKMVEVGRGRRPVWMQFQAMAWEDFYGPLTPDGPRRPDPKAIVYPTYEQMRYMAFAEIVAGATGLLFSMFNIPFGKPVWRDIQRLVAELRGLHDVLAGRTMALRLRTSYRNLGFSIWKGVTTLAKESNGRRYLLAVNNAFDPAEVTWSGFRRARSLRVRGEKRRVRIHRGSVTDWFEPYEAHVYEVE